MISDVIYAIYTGILTASALCFALLYVAYVRAFHFPLNVLQNDETVIYRSLKDMNHRIYTGFLIAATVHHHRCRFKLSNDAVHVCIPYFVHAAGVTRL
jgi:hypothetical protein